MSYPFPTPGDDELHARFGIEARAYTTEELDAAAASWALLQSSGLQAELFVRLIAVCEGSMAEAAVLWDGLRQHFSEGLKAYHERSGRYFVELYGQQVLSERSCRRAFADLAEAGLIVMWPRAKTIGQKFRVDWVDLSKRLQALDGVVLPGLDGQERGQTE